MLVGKQHLALVYLRARNLWVIGPNYGSESTKAKILEATMIRLLISVALP